eukprot:3146691-Rhodomonas_salina.1
MRTRPTMIETTWRLDQTLVRSAYLDATWRLTKTGRGSRVWGLGSRFYLVAPDSHRFELVAGISKLKVEHQTVQLTAASKRTRCQNSNCNARCQAFLQT